jgi:hypothetical protein
MALKPQVNAAILSYLAIAEKTSIYLRQQLAGLFVLLWLIVSVEHKVPYCLSLA